MNELQIDEVIKAGVYDTSRGVSRSNWQWGNVRFDEAWEGVAALIHQGWPAKQQEFPDQQEVLLGVIRRPEIVWLYRVYPAGWDGDRPGRYFFVVMQLPSLEWITDPQVAGLLAYFEKERGFPLNTKALETGWPGAVAEPVLIQLRKEFQDNPRGGHWGMDSTGSMTEFLDWEPVNMGPSEIGTLAVRERLFLGASVILAIAIGVFLLNPYGRGVNQEDKEGGKLTNISPPTVAPSPKNPEPNPEPNPASEANNPHGDDQAPGQGTYHKPEPIPEDNDTSDLNMKPKEGGEVVSPADQASGHPSPPTTKSPAAPGKP